MRESTRIPDLIEVITNNEKLMHFEKKKKAWVKAIIRTLVGQGIPIRRLSQPLKALMKENLRENPLNVLEIPGKLTAFNS